MTIWPLLSRRQFLVSGVTAGAAVVVGLGPFARRSAAVADAPARVALVGLGECGRLQAAQLSALPGVEVRAVCDADARVAEEYVRSWPYPRERTPEISTDLRPLLERRDIDVISVAVPRSARAEITRQACRAGKHVYVEPPWANTVEESRDLAEAAADGSALVWQGPADPAWDGEAIADFIRGGSATDCDQLRITVYRGCGHAPAPHAWRYSTDLFDLARMILGVEEPTRVSAAAGLALDVDGVTNSVATRIDFDAGDGRSKSLLLQTFNMPGWIAERVSAEVTSLAGAEVLGQYWIESSNPNDSHAGTGAAVTGCSLFYNKLTSGWEDGRAESLRRAHFSSTCMLQAESALRLGRPLRLS